MHWFGKTGIFGVILGLFSCVFVSSPEIPIESTDWIEDDSGLVDTLTLFSDAYPLPESTNWDFESGTLRSAIGRIHPSIVAGGAQALSEAGKHLRLNLFPSISLLAIVDRAQALGPARFVSHGHVFDYDQSSFMIANSNGILAGVIRLPGYGEYRLEFASNGTYRIRENNEFRPECLPDDSLDLMSPPPLPASELKKQALRQKGLLKRARKASTDTETVDLAIFYTNRALSMAGSMDAMNAKIDLAVAEANAAYDSSRITMKLRLVHRSQVDYKETGKMTKDLNAFTHTTDGKIDEVHAIRDSVGADIMTLVTTLGNKKFWGLGWIMNQMSTGVSNYGFNVVSMDGFTGYNVMTHEIGHNMSLLHDAAHTHDTPLFPFGYGYKFTGNDAAIYYDIMAYPPGNQIPFFSNPRLTYKGKAIGDASSADNARALDSSVTVVQNFRDAASATSGEMTSPTEGDTLSDGTTILLSAQGTNPYIVRKIEFYEDSTLIGSDSSEPFVVRWSGMDTGSHAVHAKITSYLGSAALTDTVHFNVISSTIPDNFQEGMVGWNGKSGLTTYASGVYTQQSISGGFNLTSDATEFAYQEISGDFTVIAKIGSLSGGDAVNARTGILVRDSLGESTVSLFLGINGSDQLVYDKRTKAGSKNRSNTVKRAITLPYWVKMTRVGTRLGCYKSGDGVKWSRVTGGKMNLATDVSIGLATSSYSLTTSAKARIDSLSIDTGT